MLSFNKKFCVVSLGCRVNRAEVDLYSANLINSGWFFSDIKDSDIVIINTCTVTSVADKKTRQTVRRVLKNSRNNAKIIVTGCAAALNNEFYESLDNRVIVVSKSKINEFLQSVLNIAFDQEKSVRNLYKSPFRSRASLKIQDGCDNECSYCIVCKARGKSFSIDSKMIYNQVGVMLKSGIKEIVLTGVNLGAYSYKDTDISVLCKKICKLIDLNYPSRIRLSSIEPNSINDSLINLLGVSDGKICRYLHIPLQSGSSKVLKEMNRNYTAEQYYGLICKLQDKIPEIAISTDVIVGFPGETDQDFDKTYELCKKCKFMKIHVFPYSKREGTKAAIRKDQVSDNVKTDRASRLRYLSDKLSKNDLLSRKGNSEMVLIEDKNKARTESYHLIDLVTDGNVGELLNIKL